MAARSSAATACLALVLFSIGSAAAKEPHAAWEAGASIEETYSTNIQQSPSAEEQDDFITEMAAQVQLNNESISALPTETLLSVRGYVYADHSDFDYAEIRPEVRYRIGRVEPYVQYLFSPRRFLFDDDDGGKGTAFYADHLGAVGFRGKLGRHKQLRTRLAFEIEYQNFRDDFTSHNALIPGVRAGLRYTICAMLTPMLDFQYSVRDTHRQNYDRDEIELAPGFESQLTDWLQLHFRYKHEWRSYTVEDQKTAGGRTNRNFGRDDDIDETETWLVTPLPFFRGLSVGLRHRYRHGDSNRNERRYDLHEGGIALTYNFSGDWPWD
jgi:hypothetical protein